MTEPRDEIDAWLAGDVHPMAPPPGTFELVRRRARRRKHRQALAASAAAVVVIAGGVLIPAAATGLLSGPGPAAPGPAAAGPSRQTRPAPTPSAPGPRSATALPPPAVTGAALSATTSGAAVPPRFQPTSITMIGGSVGAVIGQAGTPGHCGPPVAADCTSLAGTSTYGSSWYGVSAPVTGAPDGGSGAGQLRFLNLSDGWAFGPALYATGDGGRSWAQVPTAGRRVTALEAAGNRAFAVLASCSGTGRDWAGGCSAFALYSLAAGGTALDRVPLDLPARAGAGAMGTPGRGGAASLVIKGNAADPERGTGYLYAPSGDILAGSVGGGAWTFAGKAPCAPGPAAASGSPLGGQLALAGGALLLNCAPAGQDGTGPGQLWESADGARWSRVAQPGGTGAARSLAGTSAGRLVLATTTAIFYTTVPGPGAWRGAAVTGGMPAGGFSYVGMTSPSQGVALPADAALGKVYTTADGGRSWTAHQVSPAGSS